MSKKNNSSRRLSAEALKSPEFSLPQDNLLQKIKRAFPVSPKEKEIVDENKRRWSQISRSFLPVLNALSSDNEGGGEKNRKMNIKAVRNWLLEKQNKKHARTTGKMFLLHLRGKMIDPRTGDIIRRGIPITEVDRLNCLYVLNEIFQYQKKKLFEEENRRKKKKKNDDGKEDKKNLPPKEIVLKCDYRDRWAHLLSDFLEECGKELNEESSKSFRRVITIWFEKQILRKELLDSIKKYCDPSYVFQQQQTKKKQTKFFSSSSSPPEGKGNNNDDGRDRDWSLEQSQGTSGGGRGAGANRHLERLKEVSSGGVSNNSRDRSTAYRGGGDDDDDKNNNGNIDHQERRRKRMRNAPPRYNNNNNTNRPPFYNNVKRRRYEYEYEHNPNNQRARPPERKKWQKQGGVVGKRWESDDEGY